MRKCAAAIAIAKRPNIREISPQFIIHDNVASFVGDNTGPVESQILCVGNASYGEQKVAAHDFRRPFLAAKTGDDLVPSGFHRKAFRMQSNAEIILLYNLPEALGEALIFTPYNSGPNLNDSNFASEAAIHLAELQPNVT